LPLPIDVGQAIVDYLFHGRPGTSSRAVFVRAVAPFTTWRSSASASTGRHSRARGLLFYRLLQYAAAAPSMTYRQLVANPQPKAIKPSGVKGPGSRPSSLAQPPEDRPWRAAASLE